ncbi:hypothetical protein ACWGH7_32375 [Streptomyces cyaneofuscatus]|nr:MULTISPECIES: hypothetical protein [Streptomyces]
MVRRVMASLPPEPVALLLYGTLPEHNRRQVLEAVAGGPPSR